MASPTCTNQEDEDVCELPPAEFPKETDEFIEALYTKASTSALFNPAPEYYYRETLKALGRPPLQTSVRFDPHRYSAEEAFTVLHGLVENECRERGLDMLTIKLCPSVPDAYVISCPLLPKVVPARAEIVVGLECAMSVLRGADVFAPGVSGMTQNVRQGELVSLWADVDKKCARGLATKFTGRRVFVGNGIAEVSRPDFFHPQGPANGRIVRVTQPLYHAVALPLLSLERQTGLCLQNLPSCVVAHVLGPTPGERVLDFCAAPGGKTLHISALMNDQGLLVGLERGALKTEKLAAVIQQQGSRNTHIFHCDATKAPLRLGALLAARLNLQSPASVPPSSCSSSALPTKLESDSTPSGASFHASARLAPLNASTHGAEQCTPVGGTPCADVLSGWPRVFDRVLLDAPCSGLGQRPRTVNPVTLHDLRGYAAYQKKLFEAAVAMVKRGGVLVYSTCTINPEENEGVVGWALQQFPNIQLVPQSPYLGSSGLPSVGLADIHLQLVQRFHPAVSGTIGFFIAKFIVN